MATHYDNTTSFYGSMTHAEYMKNDGQTMSLGPRLTVFWNACMHNNKGPFMITLIIGIVCGCVTLFRAYQHSKALDKAPVCLLRGYYKNMLIFPVAWATSAMLTILCPRSSLLAELMRGISEAFALWTFLCVMWSVLSIEAIQRKKAETGMEDHGAQWNRLQGEDHGELNVGKAIVDTINKDGPKKHFAVPPFGCCFVKCCCELNMSASILLRAAFLAKQYVYCQVFVSVLGMWAIMTMPSEQGEKVAHYSKLILKLSAFCAIYGLFIVYKSTHDILHEWRTTAKFISIKFVILLSILQSLMVSALIKKFRKPDHTCLMDPYEPNSLEFVNNHYNAVCVSISSMAMIYLVSRAFPVEEVVDTHIRHVDLMDLELQGLGDYGASDAEGASSGSE